MYQQDFHPVSGPLMWSALVAALPLLTLFVLLGVLRVRAHLAAMASLGVALAVAIAAYGMPAGQALDAAALGVAFGLFPIMWIVWNAIWIYEMTRETGHFAVLRRSFGAISDDERVQAIIIAFCFGALLEALAGFGTPVAITSVMLVALGFRPLKAASVALVANTAPVAFGAIAVPIVTLAEVTGLPKGDLGAMVGRQTPLLALVVPLILVGMTDGRRGLRQTWPAALVAGFAFGAAQFACSNYVSVELTDIVASLASVAAVVALLRVWHPARPRAAPAGGMPGRPAIAGGAIDDATFAAEAKRRQGDGPDTRRDVLLAYAPYLVIIAIFALAQWGPIKDALAHGASEFSWPGLNVVDPHGDPVDAATFKFNYLPAAGTLLLISGLLTMGLLRISPARGARVYGRTLNHLRYATLTVVMVLSLAYVMNLSGQTVTIGMWIAGAGGVLAFLSPIIGWLGTAVTGSDTSSNSLFGALQVTAAKNAGLSQTLLAAANSSGGVLGKMISPQNLAIGAAAVGMGGREGDLFRRVLGWSVVLLIAMGAIVYLQSTGVLDWMVAGG